MSENSMYADELPKDFDPSAELASEVLRNELGDFFSEDDERFHVAAWESQNRRPLKMQCESWTQFMNRKLKFPRGKPALIDTLTASEDLDRLLKLDFDDLTEADAEKVKGRINECEERLSLPKSDFSKPKPKPEDADKASLARFERIEKEATYLDRIKLIQQERDIGALNLVAMRDQNEEVRQAAERRIISITVRVR